MVANLQESSSSRSAAKPFLKWAGGKKQLLSKLRQYYPFNDGKITKYVEPFVGGGAVLFDVLNSFENLTNIYINDVNEELINTYCMIRDRVEDLLKILQEMQTAYDSMDIEHRKQYYFEQRMLFNKLKSEDIHNTCNVNRAALMIFLNKTCFNGLFRVNRMGAFNVPMGSYRHPVICDEYNLKAASNKLQRVSISSGGYQTVAEFIDDKTFVYIDPPYRPITPTANFTAYNTDLFSDKEQYELANFVHALHKKKAKFLLSNSDPKNFDSTDNFFDELYAEYRIERVSANRMINCKGGNRGKVTELLISN